MLTSGQPRARTSSWFLAKSCAKRASRASLRARQLLSLLRVLALQPPGTHRRKRCCRTVAWYSSWRSPGTRGREALFLGSILDWRPQFINRSAKESCWRFMNSAWAPRASELGSVPYPGQHGACLGLTRRLCSLCLRKTLSLAECLQPLPMDRHASKNLCHPTAHATGVVGLPIVGHLGVEKADNINLYMISKSLRL